MKRLRDLCLLLLLSIATIFCITACNPNSNGESGENPSDAKVTYEITLDTSKVSVDTSEVSVCLYSLDGTSVGEKKLSKNKTQFELDADSYVATLSGLSEEVSYSSVMLTKNSKKATIILENTEYDVFSKTYSFAVTVIVMTGGIDIAKLDVQLCDDSLCRPVWFGNSNIADLFLNTGVYEVKVYRYTDNEYDEIYHENYEITLEKRFCIIVL